jgi:hypothetical protein
MKEMGIVKRCYGCNNNPCTCSGRHNQIVHGEMPKGRLDKRSRTAEKPIEPSAKPVPDKRTPQQGKQIAPARVHEK